MSVVGIDLGTTASCVAVAYQKKISVVPNGMSKWTTPTLCAFGKKERSYGTDAESQWSRNWKNTIPQIKRFLGRQYNDNNTKNELKEWLLVDTCVAEAKVDERIAFNIDTSQGKKVLLPEQILPGYLDTLKKFTRKYLNGLPVKDCVIACPNYFDDAQRRALLTACKLADLNVLRLMNENTAIALNYGILRQLPEQETRRVMFIDVGYANVQVSLVDFIKGKLSTFYTASNPNVGTRSFDKVLFDHFLKQWFSKNKDVNESNIHNYPKSILRLQQEVVKIKKLLSANKDAHWCIECFMNDKDFNIQITRDELVQLSTNVFKEISAPIIECLDYMKNNNKSNVILHSVEIVGGGGYIPSVRESILKTVSTYKESLKHNITQLSKTLNGDESVARGCALMCAMLSPNFKVRDFQVCDINNYPILIDYPSTTNENTSNNDRISKLVIKRGNPSPCNAKISFYKKKNFNINIKHPILFESKNKDGVINKYTWEYPFNTKLDIGYFDIELLPFLDNPMQEPKIKLTLNLNRHGVLDYPEAYLIEYFEKEVKVAVEQVKKEEPAKKDEKKDVKKDDGGKDEVKNDDNVKKDENNTNNNDNNNNTQSPKDEPMKDASKKDESMDIDNDKTDQPKEDNTTKKEEQKPEPTKPKEPEYKIEKRKQKSTRALKIKGKFHNEISKQRFNSFYELEAQYLNTDRIIHETNEAKNNLEAFIYDTRDKFDESHKDYINENDLESLKNKLEKFEDWLYDEGDNANKTQYNEKLTELQNIVAPVNVRKWEFENRPNRVENFKKLMFTYIRFADSEDEKYSHIEKSKKDEVKKLAQEGDQWITNLLIKQDKKKKFEDPIFKCHEIDQKYREIMEKVNPIMNTPKPKPKPKPEPKKDDDNKQKTNDNNNNKSNNNDPDTQMKNGDNKNNNNKDNNDNNKPKNDESKKDEPKTDDNKPNTNENMDVDK